jgi:hypothetical protein
MSTVLCGIGGARRTVPTAFVVGPVRCGSNGGGGGGGGVNGACKLSRLFIVLNLTTESELNVTVGVELVWLLFIDAICALTGGGGGGARTDFSETRFKSEHDNSLLIWSFWKRLGERSFEPMTELFVCHCLPDTGGGGGGSRGGGLCGITGCTGETGDVFGGICICKDDRVEVGNGLIVGLINVSFVTENETKLTDISMRIIFYLGHVINLEVISVSDFVWSILDEWASS